ncbi:MAG: AAA family ATPase [Planctomycetes bacterium]|nr:AAA family ATPase [Planctomycetota bacterium]
MDSVKHWRPSTFSEIIGARNRRTVQRLQRAAIQRQPLAGILLGQYGSAKTSLAQLLMKSYVCQRPGAETGNPCGTCPHCRSVRSDYNGESHTFQHWEIDCSQPLTREDIGQLVEEARSSIWPPFIILDEFHRLSKRSAQDVLLKFAEGLQHGVLLAIAMTDSDRPGAWSTQIRPALLDRLKRYYLALPEPNEMASLLWGKMQSWNIDSTAEALSELVDRSQCSFRTCLNILDEARNVNGGVLDIELIDEILPPCRPTSQDWTDPFADDAEETQECE